MLLLLDTHVIIEMIETAKQRANAPAEGGAVGSTDHSYFVSVASLWEIAIKVRAGKLIVPTAVQDLALVWERFGWTVLQISSAHVTREVEPWPSTQDPFDRLLLAVCSVEGLRLVTRDKKLVDHPLAWRGGSA